MPLKLGSLTEKKDLPTCSLENSIAQNIHLILTTSFGEFKQDDSFGCSIWEYDFENTTRNNHWKDQIAKSIKESVEKHEKRLTNVHVKAEVGQEEIRNKDGSRVNKKIEIKLTGNLNLTNQHFEFFEKIFVSPFSPE